jgi:hypothetical protein
MAAGNPTAGVRTGARPGRGVGGFARRLTTETKHAVKTTEFYAYVVTFALILIAGAQISEKNNVDAFRADKVWLYITILTVGYMVSRGLAKSGSSDPYWEDSGDNRNRDIDSHDDRS